MPHALLRLILLQSRGFARRTAVGARSPRRAVFLLIGLGVIVLWLVPAVVTRIAIRHDSARSEFSSHHFREISPLVLLGVCLLTIISSAGDKAIAFTPGEVDLLFPGPFTRRQLLAYKLLKSALAALLTSLLVSIGLMPYAHEWIACFVGAYLTLLFVQLFSTAGVLLGQAIGQRVYTIARTALVVASLGVVLLLARHWMLGMGGIEGIEAFRDTDIGNVVLSPFEPFGDAMTADSLVDFTSAAGEAIAIIIGLLLVVVLLDANYLEAALSASQRRYAQIQRIRGGSLLNSSLKGDVKWRLPAPVWLGGAGPIIWRQATNAARSAKGLMMVLLLVAVAVGPLFASALKASDIAQPLLAVLAWLTILLSGLLKFDFRGDLDHIDALKALPLPPSTIAIGQLVVPTLILSTAHILLLTGVAATAPARSALLLTAAALALPFNGLLMSAENLIFLLFPSRPAAASPGDFQVLGRQAAQLVLKSIFVIMGCVIALVVAVPLFILTGGSYLVLIAVAGSLLTAEICALVPAIAWAYNRFDPSLDIPA
jgi:putative ABC exporter